MSEPERRIFARKASGLVREATLTDALIVSLFNAGALLVNVFLIPLYAAVFPGANLPLAALIGGGLAIATHITYASIGSTMPRAGGDYIYQSRGIHPFIGFSIVMGILVILAFPFVTASSVLAVSWNGFSAIATFVGAATNNFALVDWGFWLFSPIGVEVVTVIALVIAFFNAVVGMRWFSRVQRYVLIPLLVISGVTMLYIFASTSRGAFISNFNSFGAAFGVENLYDAVWKQAAANGYATPEFSLVNTLFVAFIVCAWALYAIAPNYLLGEVKGAGSFRGLTGAYIIGSLLSVVGFIFLETLLIERMIGWDFLHAVSFVGQFEAWGVIPDPVMPFYPDFGVLTAIAAGTPVLIVLGLVGYISAGYFIILFTMVAMSRVLVAMSLDGTLPPALSSISTRLRGPRNAVLFMFILLLVSNSIFALYPESFLVILNGTVPASMLNLFFTSIAVTLFPFTQRHIFLAGPVGKYRFAVVGVAIVSIIVTGSIVYAYFTEPGYGIGAVGAYINAISFVAAAIWYLAYKAYQKSRGIDISLAFKEIPPE